MSRQEKSFEAAGEKAGKQEWEYFSALYEAEKMEAEEPSERTSEKWDKRAEAWEAERREDRMALYRSLRQLDPETREVIYLRLAGEFSFREVGELMGQSEVWARVRFYRGKEKLAKLLTGGRPNG